VKLGFFLLPRLSFVGAQLDVMGGFCSPDPPARSSLTAPSHPFFHHPSRHLPIPLSIIPPGTFPFLLPSPLTAPSHPSFHHPSRHLPAPPSMRQNRGMAFCSSARRPGLMQGQGGGVLAGAATCRSPVGTRGHPAGSSGQTGAGETPHCH